MKNSVNIDELVNRAAKEAAKEAIFEFDKSQKDKRFHNTRILMINYNKLKDHIDNVRDDYSDLDLFEVDEEDKVWITSIARTKLRTMQMMAYIDSALEIVKRKMEEECIEYKFKAFELYYIQEKSNDEIMSMLGCGVNQPKRWSDLILNELSIYLWGIEALGL